MKALIPVERIENKIFWIRGQKVMLDDDLAALYGVPTKRLNEQVKRNRERFPSDFMFQLTMAELANLRSQFATSKWGGRRNRPYAFTEQGVAMLSSALRSRKAVMVNIQIMRAFVRIKQFLSPHKDLENKFNLLQERFGRHLKRHDKEIALIFEAIRKMLAIEGKPGKRIGFIVEENEDRGQNSNESKA